MTRPDGGRVSVTRRIDAPVERVFASISDPARHPSFDGSGMLRDSTSNEPIQAVGDVFTVKMHNDEMGDYEMRNRVVDYELNRRIVWEPVLSAASRAEDVADIGVRFGHRWGYELEGDGDATVVTETFDCSVSPAWLRQAVKDGERWVAAMMATLDLLNRECSQPERSRVR